MNQLPDGTQAIAEPFTTGWEGRKNVAYRDIRGIWTNGIGNTHNVIPGSTITDAQIDSDFEDNMNIAGNGLMAHLDPSIVLNANEAAALIDFIFNLGIHAFVTSTLLRDINAGVSGDAIAVQIERWDHAGVEVVDDLVRRRKAEADLYNTPMPDNDNDDGDAIAA